MKKSKFCLCRFIPMVVLLGMLTACSAKEQTQKNPPAAGAFEAEPEEMTENNREEESTAHTGPTERLEDNAAGTEPERSKDAQEMEEVVLGFAEGYFSGDKEVIRQFLTEPYEWEVEVYETAKAKDYKIEVEEIKGIEGTEDMAAGDVHVVYLIFKETPDSDSNNSLTVELVKTLQGWKIQFYGLEG